MDYTVEDTIYLMFTTRIFATGIPGTLAGTPVISAYENDSTAQITAGITLGVDHDSVTGLNLLTIAATGANGYEAGKDYNLVITTGSVSSVSVVGETIGTFSLSRSAAAVDLANGTDGLGAIKAETALIVGDTNELQTDNIPGTLAGLATTTELNKVPKSDGTTSWNSTALAAVNAECDTALSDYDPPTRAELTTDIGTVVTDLDDIKGTGFVKDTHSLIDIETYVDILDDGTSGNAKIATDVAAALLDTNELQVDDVPGLIAALNDISSANVLTQVNAALDTAITELGVAAPTATPTVRTALMLLYMALRNKRDTTSSTDEIHNDAGTVIATATVSDDAVTFSKTEYA